MKLTAKCAWAVVLGAILVGTVQAEIMSDSASATLINDTDITLYLDKIDLAPMYQLTNVYVEVEVRLSDARVQMDNDEVAAQEGTARVINTASSLTSTAVLLKTNYDTINNGDMGMSESQVYSLSETTGDPLGEFNATLDTDYANWQPGLLTAGDSGNISSSVWGSYEGTGQFSITINSTFVTSATFEGGNAYFEGNTPTGEFYAEVVYEYEYVDVPEPGTLTMLIAGLFGLLVIARKRHG